ncbi:MAG: sporulation integral membrane protein YtvI [Clostridia bacterium]|nr:sporulation integral membrane protein YtvI [Clostridia bacterium]MDD4798122.1 sporulation integral membrane protein YtvI [Clostridia bacterium]
MKASRDSLIDKLLFSGIVLIVSLVLYLLVYYLVPSMGKVIGTIVFLILPFVIAMLCSVLAKPLVEFFAVKCRMPRSLAVLLMMFLVLGIFVTFLGIIIARLVVLFADLATKLPQISETIQKWFSELQIFYNSLDKQSEVFIKAREWLLSFSETVGNAIGNGASGFVEFLSGTPIAVFFIFVTLVAIFFWCRDDAKIENALCSLVPQKHANKARNIYHSCGEIIGGYCRAQLVLIAVTMLISIVVYSILGVEGAFSLGLLTGLLDLLPVLGPGTLIVPWSIYKLLTGNYFVGVSLLIFYAAIVIVRNILEPKIVGDRLGMHPLLTLAAIFIGMKLFGVVGLILGPIVCSLALTVYRASKKPV